MKLSECQRKLFEEFSQIIRENRLSHAYLFSGDFGSLDMAIRSHFLPCRIKCVHNDAAPSEPEALAPLPPLWNYI